MEEKKINVVAQTKNEPIKLCPFINGTFLVPKIKPLAKQPEFVPQTNITPCIVENCVFYDRTAQSCKILLCMDFYIKNNQEVK